VLRDAYGLDRRAMTDALERILETAQFQVEERDLVRHAVDDYRTGPGDFADYVIGRRNQGAGCSDTAAFSR